MTDLLRVNDLHVSFDTYAGEVKAVRGVSFNVKVGETLALVGESGCGKSVTAQTIMRLIPSPPSRIVKGEIFIEDVDIVKLTEEQMRKLRGSVISMIFQDPMTCLNPTMTIGAQIEETLKVHNRFDRSEIKDKVIEMLKIVQIPNPEKRAKQYPHEFSGGMRQRIMIAMALSCSPKLLIADEPTTALDVTIQAQVLELLKQIQKVLKKSIIIITHDLGVVADSADRVAVMYAGKIVEMGNLDDIYYRPKHPYTWGLLKSVPRLDQKKSEKLHTILGTPPDLFAPPPGCGFADRCDYCMRICKEKEPPLIDLGNGHTCCCWLVYRDMYYKEASGGGI